MNNSVGEAVFTIKVDASGAKQSLNDWKSQLNSSVSDSEQATKSLSTGFDELASSVASLATAGVAFSGLKSAIGDVTDAYNSYQAAMNGIKAVARATGNDVSDSMSAIRGATASGLVSQEDAAAAMKNLQLYGYTVEQAAQMINIMTDAAVYNRQANYSVSEAVRVTTEGIRMENSVLSDASGITTNIARMYQNYAQELGTTTDKLTQAQKAQAVYNGFLQEGGVFAGNAEEYTNTLAGAQQQLSTAMIQVKQSLGSMFESFAPIISGIANWTTENKELVAVLATVVGTLVGGTGLVASISVASKAIAGIATAVGGLKVSMAVLQVGIVGVAAALVGLGAALLSPQANVQNLGMKLGQSAILGDRVVGTMDLAGESIEEMGTSAGSVANNLDDLNESLSHLELNHNRSLKKIAVSHEENLAKLTEQIKEANVDYRRAIDERTAEFNVSLAKEERTHQEMVNELMTQLNFLQRYNNDYNKQKLAQVQFALAKEQALYEKQTAAEKAEIELQNAADKQKLDAKLASLQKELDDEQAFMNKHRDTLNSVRDVILLDEIESLKEQYEQQRQGILKQIDQAYKGGASAANGFWNGYDNVNKHQLDIHAVEVRRLTDSISGKNGQARVIDPNSLTKLLAKGGYSTGGFTGRGDPDEIAGVVHKGEYVIPADQVNQNTGLPKSTGNPTVQNFTFNLSGILATSAQAKRELAAELQRALQQTNQARLA